MNELAAPLFILAILTIYLVGYAIRHRALWATVLAAGGTVALTCGVYLGSTAATEPPVQAPPAEITTASQML